MTSGSLYKLGYAIVVAGLALAAFLMGVPIVVIAVLVVVALLIGKLIARMSANRVPLQEKTGPE